MTEIISEELRRRGHRIKVEVRSGFKFEFIWWMREDSAMCDLIAVWLSGNGIQYVGQDYRARDLEYCVEDPTFDPEKFVDRIEELYRCV